MRRFHTLFIIFTTLAFYGIKIFSLSVGSSVEFASVALQSDGKLVAGGGVTDSSQVRRFIIARYNTDGTIDTSLDTDGVATTLIGIKSAINDVAIQTGDQFIVAAGFARESGSSKFAIARYDTTGALDTGFDSNGYTTTLIGTASRAEAVAIQADGKLVVCGIALSGFPQFAVVRYNSTGSLDTDFDSDGIVTTQIGVRARALDLVIQSDGKIVVVGASEGKFALARYNSNGSLDTGFGTNGIVTTTIGVHASAHAVALDGTNIVVAGVARVNNKNQFAIARYTSTGALDTSFDSDGIVTTEIRTRARALDIAVDGSSNIIAVGNVDDMFTYSEYSSTGSLTRTVITDIDKDSQANGIVIDGSGKYVVIGTASTDGVCVRYNSDGTLDDTFADEGINNDVGGESDNGVTFIFDRKNNNVDGGDFNSGSWQTRDLNVIAGNHSNITLSSNQFTIQPGVYLFEAFVPAFRVGRNQARIWNITNSKLVKRGSSTVARNETSGTMSYSIIHHYLRVNEAKTFEVQHRCVTTKLADGFGRASGLGAASEIYTQVKITRLA